MRTLNTERIKEAVDLVALVGDYVKLQRVGAGKYVASCPFHKEKTASFKLGSIPGMWKCFGCGKAGDAITFIREFEQVSFHKALEILADRTGVPLQGGSISPRAASLARQDAKLCALWWREQREWFADQGSASMVNGDHAWATTVGGMIDWAVRMKPAEAFAIFRSRVSRRERDKLQRRLDAEAGVSAPELEFWEGLLSRLLAA